jgi:hypothetical protein
MSAQTLSLQPVVGTGTDHALQRLAKMFAALSAANEAILRTNSREELFRQVCEAAHQSGNFNGTVVLLPEAETGMLKAVAGAGENVGLLSQVPFSIDPAIVYGRGICGTAFRTQKICINNNLFSDRRVKSWQQDARRAGVGASAALPLIQSGVSIGVFMVTLAETDSLDDETVSLLTRMADNLSFGLDNLDREAERKRSEKTAQRLAKMYAALSATNEAILRAATAHELYNLVCEAAVHVGNSLAAVVLLVEPGTSWLRPVAGNGQSVEQISRPASQSIMTIPMARGSAARLSARNRHKSTKTSSIPSRENPGARPAFSQEWSRAALCLSSRTDTVSASSCFFSRSSAQ